MPLLQSQSEITFHAIVDLSTSLTRGFFRVGYGCPYYSDGDVEMPSAGMEGMTAVELLPETLRGLSAGEFLAIKKAIVVDGSFDSWGSRDPAPTMALLNDIPPKSDGSVVATVNITAGPANSPFKITGLPAALATNLTDDAGVLDGSGAGSFTLTASGGGGDTHPLVIEPDGHQDFINGAIEVTIEAAA